MKKKYINGIHWDWLDKYSSHCIHIDDMLSGYISIIKVDKVKYKINVDYKNSELCLFDDGYKCLIFLPDNDNWCISTVYNDLGEIIEWYIDMTKENSIDELGNPFFIDLYLDIAISPDFQINILDEDELQEALDLKIITQLDYDLAYHTCNRVIDEIIPNKDFLVAFFNKYMHLG